MVLCDILSDFIIWLLYLNFIVLMQSLLALLKEQNVLNSKIMLPWSKKQAANSET